MITNEMLRCIERATGHDDAVASLGKQGGSDVLKLVVKDRECLIKLDRSFSEDPPLAMAITRHVIHSIQRDLADRALKDLESLL